MAESLRLLMTADTIGGVWTYCVELAAALAPYGVEIALASMGARPTAAQQAQIARLPNTVLFPSEYRLEWMDDAWPQVEKAGDWLLELTCDFQPDIVHLNGYVHAALPWECPVLIAAHSCVLSWWDAVNGEAAPECYAEYRGRVEHGLRSADLVVAPTKAMLTALRAHYAFATPQAVIPNGRRADLFAPSVKQPIIFSAGRLWDQAKNTALLERIAPRLTWPVQLAGATRQPSALPGSHPKPSVTSLGELSPTEIAVRLAGASIYAAPARYEPFGLGILEAALAGCALVLSDLPSLRENWEGAAVFVPSGDGEGWLRALNGLAEDSERLMTAATRARTRALRFTPERTAETYFSTYQMLASAHPSRSLAGCLP